MKEPKLRHRTCYCNDLREKDIDKNVILMGWVAKTRKLGGAIFLDLRDHTGITQLVFAEDQNAELHARASELKNEDVIAVEGKVISRGENATTKIDTGAVEVQVTDLHVYSKSETLPFPVRDEITANFDTRLKYRYLDLRRPVMQKYTKLRTKFTYLIRNFLIENDFLDIETPYMVKYTPGGARNFLVPSRLNPGKYYALAESPQIYKQLLMIAGYDKYFQIAKCFRDEDPRHDRQIEFTQIDLEMSFADQEDVIELVEKMLINVWAALGKKFISVPFPKLSWHKSMELYGNDKPDLRYELKHVILNDFAKNCGFSVLESAAENGLVKGMTVPDSAKLFSRKILNELTDFVKKQEIGEAKGLVWLKVKEDNTLQGPAAKFFGEEKTAELLEKMSAKSGDTIFIIADDHETVHKTMSNLRIKIAEDLKLIDNNAYAGVWITDFPMFEKNAEGKWTSSHHPFTHPHPDDIELLGTERQGEARSLAYDVVINGNEIGGGSVRIHNPDIQEKVFNALGLSEEEIEEKFGFLLEAYKYGAPPHAGFAGGLDRAMMLLAKTESLRDVIAFPKTITGTDTMTSAPTFVSEKQLAELFGKKKETTTNI